MISIILGLLLLLLINVPIFYLMLRKPSDATSDAAPEPAAEGASAAE